MLLLVARSFGQKTIDSSYHPPVPTLPSYNPTNFDPFSLWNYTLDSSFESRKWDSVKPIAAVSIWRNQPLWNKGKPEGPDDKQLKPGMHFNIFNLADSAFCYQTGRMTQLVSSHVPPNVAGDVIIVGNLILVCDYCHECGKLLPGNDYCRGFIKRLFKYLNGRRIATIADIVQQLPIKPGKWPILTM